MADAVIISVHLPKTGGTTFRELLSSHFGGALHGDYGDWPINVTPDRRISSANHERERLDSGGFAELSAAGVECVHGHFLPYKYAGFVDDPGVRFVTWMRDPLDRLVSHYRFWMRSGDGGAELHARVRAEEWSLERFCFSSELRNLYDQFLWRFPLESFDFIGITEHYDSDLATFGEDVLGVSLPVVEHRNVDPAPAAPLTDPGMIRDLREFHAADVALYERALDLRRSRAEKRSIPDAGKHRGYSESG